MKLIVSMGVLLLLVSGASAQNLLTNGDFQDLDAWDDIGDGYTYWAIGPDDVYPEWHDDAGDPVPDGELDAWYRKGTFYLDGPGNGDPDNWFARHQYWSDVKLGQAITAPAMGTDLKLTFDYTWAGNLYTNNWVVVQGVNQGEVLNYTGGRDIEGVELGRFIPVNTDWHEWLVGELEVTVDADYDYIAVVVIVSSDDGRDRGVDNMVLEVVVTDVPGDADGDGVVDLTDLGILATNWGRTDVTVGAGEGDFDDSGTVDLSDLGILATNWGTGTEAVPEPATMSLLGLGALALIRRRK